MKARIHWNIQKRLWTVHTYKGCEWARYVVIKGDWITEVKPNNKSNPRGFVVCDRSQVELHNGFLPAEFLPDLENELRYDKKLVKFNLEGGRDLTLVPFGAFMWRNAG